jgi:hypothetical protein
VLDNIKSSHHQQTPIILILVFTYIIIMDSTINTPKPLDDNTMDDNTTDDNTMDDNTMDENTMDGNTKENNTSNNNTEPTTVLNKHSKD